jgi:hypothetical protein
MNSQVCISELPPYRERPLSGLGARQGTQRIARDDCECCTRHGLVFNVDSGVPVAEKRRSLQRNLQGDQPAGLIHLWVIRGRRVSLYLLELSARYPDISIVCIFL